MTTMNLKKWLSGLVMIAGTLFIPTLSFAKIIYVNHAVIGSHNGSSWNNAFNNLQVALQTATSNDQIWVAKGNYYPSNSGNRQASFKIPANVSIFGGFIGNETRLSQRNYQQNLTVLDGNIQHSNIQQTYSQHVVIMGDDSVLDGFTVQHGYSIPLSGDHRFGHNQSQSPQQNHPSNHTTPQAILSGHLSGSGGGIVNAHAAGTVKNCIIQNNVALKGAGSYNMVQKGIPVYISAWSKSHEIIAHRKISQEIF